MSFARSFYALVSFYAVFDIKGAFIPKKPLLPAAAEAGAKEVFCWCAWHGHNDLAMKYQSGLDSRNC